MNWYVLVGMILHMICSYAIAGDFGWARWHHKHQALARQLHVFLRSPRKGERTSTKWLGFAVLYHGSKKDTRCLLKSGASPLIQFFDDFELLRRLYNHSQLNNFKRLLLRGARYYSPRMNRVCLYETFDRPELPKRMKDYVQALLDFGAFKEGTTQPPIQNTNTLKDLCITKITNDLVNKTPGAPTLQAIIKKTPWDLHEALAKYLVEKTSTQSLMIFFAHIAKLNKSNAAKRYPVFFKAVKTHFNCLQAQKYNTIASAVLDTDALYDLKPLDFETILKDASHLLK